MSVSVDMSACADMCRHVPLISTLQIATISTLSGCWHVSVSVAIYGHVLICADMCWHVPRCANMWHYSRHLWWRSFRLYLDAGMCQYLWICRHVLICANMCRHVPTCETTLSTSDANHLKRILHVGMCQHIWTCRHVLICADMCQHVKPPLAPLIPTIWNLSWMLACVSTFGHADMCWYEPTCADMCWHEPTCANMWH